MKENVITNNKSYEQKLKRCQDEKTGLWGFIDKTGQIVIPCIWANVGWFRNGHVRVQTVLGGGWHEIDRNGNAV